jgi:cell pole-organizing protein PopZ
MASAENQDSSNQEQWNNSSEVTNAAQSVFKSLQQTIAVDNSRTLEDLTREMLRPMLKVWLDENLPLLVERLVRAEIDRVSKPSSPNSSAS